MHISHDEAFVTYVVMSALVLDKILLLTPCLLRRLSQSLSWLFVCITFPLILLALAFAAATTSRSQWSESSAVIVHVSGAILILAVPAASIPSGPPKGTQRFADGFFVCVTAIAWHAVGVKWEETAHAGYLSQLVRRGLVLSLAIVISAAACLQWLLGQSRFWHVCRLCAVVCGALRLLAILLLVHDPDTTTSYPPGALPFHTAVAVVFVMPVVACFLTADARQRLARAARITERMGRLANRRKCSSVSEPGGPQT
jgi:hypothetical protein